MNISSSKVMVVAFTLITMVLVGVTWLVCDAPGLAWRAIQQNVERERTPPKKKPSPRA